MTLAGLWDEWKDPRSGLVRSTHTIVTTTPTSMMMRIHNNPTLEDGPGMPLISPKELERDWLNSINDKADKELIESVIHPYDESELVSFTVARLLGKTTITNTPEALLHRVYTESESTQGSLF